jgi:hypothetical protein
MASSQEDAITARSACTIGTMKLFHRPPGPVADLVLGQALADAATIGILSERAIRRGEALTER